MHLLADKGKLSMRNMSIVTAQFTCMETQPDWPQWDKTKNKHTIHQVTTMLATAKKVLFPSHNQHGNH